MSISRMSFNPFQGFIRVFTGNGDQGVHHVFGVLIPSRDLLGFSQAFNLSAGGGEILVLIPSRDLLGFSQWFTDLMELIDDRFNPFQGFIRVFTQQPSRGWP